MQQQMSTNDEQFMCDALAEARAAAAEGEVPIGAVVVREGQVIARAHNRREADADPSAHAEFSAIVAAARQLGRWRLPDCTVYVTLEPCCMCAGLMVNARIGRCVYGAADPKGGALGSLYQLNADARLNHAFSVRAGVLEAECAELLREFFAGARARQRSLGVRKMAAGFAEDAAPAEVAAPAEAAVTSRAFDRASGASERPLRVVLAVDSFKGSATSSQAEAWLAEGIRSAAPTAQLTALPIADGGEGTVDAVWAARGGTLRTVEVSGPLDVRHEARYLLVAGDEAAGAAGQVAFDGAALRAPVAGVSSALPFAVIEMAEAAGIGYSACTFADALAASTFGVGELVLDAVAHGARTIYVGLGGSATNDGGAGMLQALGARLLDAAGAPVRPGLAGLRDVVSIDLTAAVQALDGVQLVVLTDVKNPLVGERGALAVFGPQKGLRFGGAEGASTRDGAGPMVEGGALDGLSLAACDCWMRDYATRLTAARDALDGTPLQVAAPGARPRQLAGVPGAGAAGGLGAAFVALGARLVPGIQTVLDLVGFDEAAGTADLIVTGEGNMDAQTAEGKAPVGVAERAKAANPQVPVVAVCGGRADDLSAVYAAGVDVVLPIARRPMALDEALVPEQTRANLVAAGETAARIVLLSC